MYDAATPLRPDQIVAALVNGLSGWAKKQKAKTSVARDPFEVIELLGADTPGLRLVVHWAGDDPLGEEMAQAPLVTHVLEIVLGLNLGLTATPDRALVSGSSGRPALYQLISDLRVAVLAVEFPSVATESYLEYAGTKPLVTPEGVPLAAYTLRFTLDAAIQTPPSTTPANFRPPAL